MSSSSVLEKLEAKLDGRKKKRAGLFRDAARRALDGRELPADDLEGILDANRLTVDDLKSEIGRLADRRKLQVAIDQAEGADAKLAEVEQRIKDSDAEFNAARIKHGQEVAALQAERQSIAAKLADAKSASKSLLENAPIEDREELAKARQSLEEAREFGTALRKKLAELVNFGHGEKQSAANVRAEIETIQARIVELSAAELAARQKCFEVV